MSSIKAIVLTGDFKRQAGREWDLVCLVLNVKRLQGAASGLSGGIMVRLLITNRLLETVRHDAEVEALGQ